MQSEGALLDVVLQVLGLHVGDEGGVWDQLLAVEEPGDVW